MAEYIKDIVGGIYKFKEGEKQQKYKEQQAEQLRKEHMARLGAMNFDYAKPSDAVPEFKATVSPVARSYLESFLTGANPDAIRTGKAGSEGLLGTKAAANGKFQTMYGGYDALKKQGDAELTQPGRFAVKPIAPVSARTKVDAVEAIKNPQYGALTNVLKRPLTSDEIAYLNEEWAGDKYVKNGEVMRKNMGLYHMKDLTKEQIEQLLADRPHIPKEHGGPLGGPGFNTVANYGDWKDD